MLGFYFQLIFTFRNKFLSLQPMKRIVLLDDLHKGSNADIHDIY